ncbi:MULTISPECIES: hypothetical protein [unclassified Providencia]|uniref:hypothetical protein n=1 Tax=unclassified Providencia TaxID=2633465 RepID=UPI0012B54AB9|nr:MULTISPECIES: hypothetical protein [unclassified Providencia]MTC21808.1 hypothetical protein [Providencia sp. wls1938]
MTDKMERERFNIKHIKKYVSNRKVNGYFLVIFILFFIITWGVVFGFATSIGAIVKWDFNENSNIYFVLGVCFFLCAKILDIFQALPKVKKTEWMHKKNTVLFFFWAGYAFDVSTPLLFVTAFRKPQDCIFIILSIVVSLLIAIIYCIKLWGIESPKKQEESKTTITDG